jgi:hypothetical protein
MAEDEMADAPEEPDAENGRSEEEDEKAFLFHVHRLFIAAICSQTPGQLSFGTCSKMSSSSSLVIAINRSGVGEVICDAPEKFSVTNNRILKSVVLFRALTPPNA